jgi:hypothetical protein
MKSFDLTKQLFWGLVAVFAMLLPNDDLSAQQYKVSSAFDSTTIRIGDQVKLHLDVDMPQNARVTFPTFKDTITGKIEVVKLLPPDSSRKDGKLHIRQDILVTSFDSGYHSIPPLNIAFQDGQTRDTLKTLPLYLTVNSMPVDTTKEFKDIKAPLGVPFSILDYWLYILIFFGLVFIAFGIWYIVKLRKKEPLFGSYKPVDPPHIIALRELDTLRAEKLWQNNKTKQYYTKLTEIIRTYIESRYEIDAMEMTSEEIVEALKSTQMDDYSQIDLLRKMFQTADLVKFAKGQPLPDENEVNLLNAYQFVNNTKINVSIQVENKEGEEPSTTDNVPN